MCKGETNTCKFFLLFFMHLPLRKKYTIKMNWGWLRGYDNDDFEDGDNADNFMGGGPLGILLYQMRYSGRCSVFYIELLLEDIDWEGGQNSNHIVVGFPTSGWVSNQWLEIHPWWVNFQPFTLVGLDAVVGSQRPELLMNVNFEPIIRGLKSDIFEV